MAEQLVSTAESLEHLLVLNQPPSYSGQVEFLELQATLELQPGASL